MAKPMSRVSVAAAVMIAAFELASGSVVAQAGRNIWDGIYTDAQAARGKKLYIESCALSRGPCAGS